MNTALVVEKLTGGMTPLAELRRTEWSGWRALTDGAAPYLAPEFFTLTRAVAGDGEALVACAHRDHRLLGVLPLRLDHGQLVALRSDHTPAYDYCGEREGLDVIWRALRNDSRWSVLTLEDVPTGSLLATRLPELARADGCRTVARPAARHRYFMLDGFEAKLSGHFRSNLHRCERKAGGVTLERIAAPGRAAIEEALAIEGLAWKSAAGSSITSSRELTHLYQTLARVLGRRGRASLSFLRVGDKRIAALIAVEDGHTLHALKIGYDPRHAAISPGHLLVWKVAADAERRGLAELDFGGIDSEWKHRWTDRVHEHVTLVVYRRTLTGRAEWALREVARPWLEQVVPDLRAPLRHGCQCDDIVADHTLLQRARGRLHMGLGIRSGIKRAFKRAFRPAPPPRDPLGATSRWAAGSWVRVRDEAAVRATLDERSRLRGLEFVPSQWQSCGRVFRVSKQVRRIKDDDGRMRPVSRTVLLDGVSCAGFRAEPSGCGRHCPLMFRDEWLEPANDPHREPPRASTRRHARVRSLEQIRAGLDLAGRRDGLSFMPGMEALVGRRFPIVQQLGAVLEYGHWVTPRRPIYILEGAQCSGAAVGRQERCDRACSLLWHEDWLLLEP
jgi:CelD/BcsL family acetyltransferase involved in cellulose biosynthesis